MTNPVGKDKVIEIVVGEIHLKAITPVDYDIEMGETAWIQFNNKRMHGFNIETTKALF